MLLDLLTELVQSVDGPVYPEQRPEAALSSRTRPEPQGRAFPQVRTLYSSAGPRHDQSLELSLAHR